MRTHYDNLKISEAAPEEVIRAAYRALSNKHHPDKNPGNKDSGRIMQILNAAHETLSDPERRRRYDAFLADERRSTSNQPPPPPITPPRPAPSSPTETNNPPKTFREKFPDMRPMGGTPLLFRFNGCGISIYGHRDHDKETGTYVKTLCLCLIFIPLVPLQAYRVADAANGGWHFLGKHQLSTFAKVWNVALLFLGTCIFFGEKQSPQPYTRSQPTTRDERRDRVENSRAARSNTRSQPITRDETPPTLPVSPATSLYADTALEDLRRGAAILQALSYRPGSAPAPSPQLTQPATEKDVVGAIPVYRRPTTAPNMQPWPVKAAYISGYQILAGGGRSSVTVDNKGNSSDIFLKLVYLTSEKAYPARLCFIPAFSEFTFSNVAPGRYDVRYRNLSTGGHSKTEQFTLTQTETQEGTEFSTFRLTLYKVPNGNMHTEAIDESEF